MGVYFDQIPDAIKNHIEEVTKTSGLPDDDDSLRNQKGGSCVAQNLQRRGTTGEDAHQWRTVSSDRRIQGGVAR